MFRKQFVVKAVVRYEEFDTKEVTLHEVKASTKVNAAIKVLNMHKDAEVQVFNTQQLMQLGVRWLNAEVSIETMTDYRQAFDPDTLYVDLTKTKEKLNSYTQEQTKAYIFNLLHLHFCLQREIGFEARNEQHEFQYAANAFLTVAADYLHNLPQNLNTTEIPRDAVQYDILNYIALLTSALNQPVFHKLQPILRQYIRQLAEESCNALDAIKPKKDSDLTPK